MQVLGVLHCLVSTLNPIFTFRGVVATPCVQNFEGLKALSRGSLSAQKTDKGRATCNIGESGSKSGRETCWDASELGRR